MADTIIEVDYGKHTENIAVTYGNIEEVRKEVKRKPWRYIFQGDVNFTETKTAQKYLDMSDQLSNIIDFLKRDYCGWKKQEKERIERWLNNFKPGPRVAEDINKFYHCETF